MAPDPRAKRPPGQRKGSSSHEETPQQDRTIEKIDELMTRLARWRQVLVQTAGADVDSEVGLRELEMVFADRKPLLEIAPRVQKATQVAAAVRGARRAARAARAIACAVDRLHAALSLPRPSDNDIRDRLAKYLDARVALIRAAPRAFTAPDAAEQMIAEVGRRWPAYGQRLGRHRVALVDGIAKLAARRRGAPKRGERHYDAKSADELREEILRWVGLPAKMEAVRKYAERKAKLAGK